MFSLDGVFSMCTCQWLGDGQGRLEAQPGRGQGQAGHAGPQEACKGIWLGSFGQRRALGGSSAEK